MKDSIDDIAIVLLGILLVQIAYIIGHLIDVVLHSLG